MVDHGVTTAMGGLLRVDPASDEPPFWQVRRQLAEAIADGRLAVGAKLPPIRALAGELGLAANTVARAYRELEVAGLVLTRGRLGTVVSPDAASPVGAADAASSGAASSAEAAGARRLAAGGEAQGPAPASVRLAAGDYARAARAAGIPEADAVGLVRDAFRRLS